MAKPYDASTRKRTQQTIHMVSAFAPRARAGQGERKIERDRRHPGIETGVGLPPEPRSMASLILLVNNVSDYYLAPARSAELRR
jgi:hypothetical protein